MDPKATYQFACYFAEAVHKGQKDKGGADYLGHLLRVASKVEGETAKTIAVLHDTIEDTWVDEPMLEKLFGDRVANAVSTLTRKDGESYTDYVNRIASTGDITVAKVKIADLEDNLDLSRLKEVTKEDLNRAMKYSKARAILENAVLESFENYTVDYEDVY